MKLFKKGDKVIVTTDGNNFCIKNHSLGKGVYQFDNWKFIIFTIEGTI